jgi:hypothetical protein
MAKGYVLLPNDMLHGPYELSTGRSSMKGSTGVDQLIREYGGPVPNGTMLSVGDKVYEMGRDGLESVASGPAGSGMVGAWTGGSQ